MSDLPFGVPSSLAALVQAAVDREGKLDRAIEQLGPIAGRRVVAVDPGPAQQARWGATAAELIVLPSFAPATTAALPAASADTIVGAWTSFRGVDPAEIAEADRILRPGGRLLAVHDYGRDDIATLRGDRPEYGTWSRRDGPFLANRFRVRVIHCFWTFDDLGTARAVVGELFGAAGERFAADLKRARLSWNVAVYHRSRGGSREAARERMVS